MSQVVYHVAGQQYESGDPLLCWDLLVAAGILTDEDWQWEDAEAGYDGDVVCLFEDRVEAEQFASERGGRLLTITLPDDADLGQYETFAGYISPRLTRVAEGYLAVRGGIPAAWITE